MFFMLYLGVFTKWKGGESFIFFPSFIKRQKLKRCKITFILTIGKNVALWKSTHQSTTYSYDGISFTPDKAVDGNGNGDWDIHTCTHTKPYGDHPTWSVDLGNMYYIIAIKIKNRNDNREYLFDLFIQANLSRFCTRYLNCKIW